MTTLHQHRLGQVLLVAGLAGVFYARRQRGAEAPPAPTPASHRVERRALSAAMPGPVSRPAPRRRRLGVILVVLGALVLAYAAGVLLWRDPATDLYARWQQHRLSAELDEAFAAQASLVSWPEALELRDTETADVPRRQERVDLTRLAVAAAANELHRKLKLGKPLGRIEIPRLGLNAVFVQGTRWGPDLSRGPGHYPSTSLPGVGRTMAIAGHRTTFGAPLRRIDSLRYGNRISLTLSYATFRYEVFKHEIVDNEDWSIVRDRGFDTLVLSACHPLYSAEKRWVVYARLVRVDPERGPSYVLTRAGRARPIGA